VLERVQAIRYVTPLREGGSLPGIVEADDLGTYVAKFRGAGQGRKALVAEVIVTELGRSLGVRVPELRVLELDPAIARYEADEEVQDLLNASLGPNLGVDFLPGAFGYDASAAPDPEIAARVLWLDAYVANVDRTWRNPNLLLWHGDVWAIDHGAALYFHHTWPNGVGSADRFAAQAYDVSEHVLGRYASGVPAAHAEVSAQVDTRLLRTVVDQVPAEWIEPAPGADTVDAVRAAYVDFLDTRLARADAWLPGSVAA
jgi:HipA-like kinase